MARWIPPSSVIGNLTWVKGKYDSVRGPITTEWKRDAKAFTLDLEIPPNTTATVFIPAASPDEVLESGGAVFETAAGKYQFTVSSQQP